jgi:hypothetical protein
MPLFTVVGIGPVTVLIVTVMYVIHYGKGEYGLGEYGVIHCWVRVK